MGKRSVGKRSVENGSVGKHSISNTWNCAAIAFVLAAGWFAVPAFVSQVSAQGAVANLSPRGQAGVPCEQQTWPYYAPECLHDARNPSTAPPAVRLITTDRLSSDPRIYIVR